MAIKAQLQKFISSSANPEELALTVKGLLTALIPIVLAVSGLAHLNVGQEQVNEVITAVVSVVTAFSALVSAIMIFVGMVRRILISLVKPSAPVVPTTAG